MKTKRKLFTYTLLLILTISPLFKSIKAQKREYQQGISFTTIESWSQLLELAKKENKPIFLDAYATWCAPCKVMEEKVFKIDSVGHFYNEKFINVRLQMDKTNKDIEAVKKLYNDADSLQKIYNISALPAFLYFSSEGKLLHHTKGFMNPNSFLSEGKFALNSESELSSLITRWRNNKLTSLEKIKLHQLAPIRSNKVLADSILKDIVEYYNTSPDEKVFDTHFLTFAKRNLNQFSSKHKIFKLAYNRPENFTPYNSLSKDRTLAEDITFNILTNEIIAPEITKAKSLLREPDWNHLSKTILGNFPEIDQQKLLLREQKEYYKSIKNWDKYVEVNNLELAKRPVLLGDIRGMIYRLNYPAVLVFEYSNNPRLLKEALKWSAESLKLSTTESDIANHMDTYANILYKLGRKKEAIEQQRRALDLAVKFGDSSKSPLSKVLIEQAEKNLTKMELGKPTWGILLN